MGGFAGLRSSALLAVRPTLRPADGDDRPFGGKDPPAAVFYASRDRTREHPERHLSGYAGILQADAFDSRRVRQPDEVRHPRRDVRDLEAAAALAERIRDALCAENVHPKTGDVWITSNMSDRIFRFTPSTKTFVSYPLPTRVTWLRDLVFAEDGGICSSSSNLPAYGIEPRQRQAASSRPFSCRATQSLPDPRMATSSASSIRPRTPTPGTRPWTGSRLRR